MTYSFRHFPEITCSSSPPPLGEDEVRGLENRQAIPGKLPRLVLVVILLMISPDSVLAESSFADVIVDVQPKIAKIYGAGGLRGLEAYQSGFLISSNGHILTVWSYVLDSDDVTVTLADGRRFQGDVLGTDPHLEIAVLKIEADELPHFDVEDAVDLPWGARILAFSNLFGIAVGDEQASVLHGTMAGLTRLSARQGAFAVRYQGPVYVLDAITNNPGAAGGVLTDRQGRLAGLLGKELRDAGTNTWLNYALPVTELSSAVQDIVAGKMRPRTSPKTVIHPEEPWSLNEMGIVLVPNVLDKTPPFIERVIPQSPAARAGLKPDDLVVYVADHVVPSLTSLVDQVRQIERDLDIRLMVLRDGELLEVELISN